MTRWMTFFVVTVNLAVSSALVAAEFDSGSNRVGVLELYTSEGCSSCPPADRFVSGLLDDPRLFKEFIPLTFHVDYWDYLGWKDRFASKAYSQRQRAYAAAGNVRTVYTPGFLYNGKEWRNFFGGDVNALPYGDSVGSLKLTTDQGKAEFEFSPAAKSEKSLRAHVALLGFGLASQVSAGENHGRKLKHDFVVLDHKSVTTTPSNGNYRATLDLPASDVEAKRYALVTWISERADSAPLQATGGFVAAAELR